MALGELDFSLQMALPFSTWSHGWLDIYRMNSKLCLVEVTKKVSF